MLRVSSYLSHPHDLTILAAAVILCFAGGGIVLHLARRMRTARWHMGQVLMTGLAGTGTLWAIHVTGLASHVYDHSYSFSAVGIAHSFALMFTGLLVSLVLAIRARHRSMLFGAGMVMGLTLVAVQYHSLATFAPITQSDIDMPLVGVSVAFATLVGGLILLRQSGWNNLRRHVTSICLMVGLMTGVHVLSGAAVLPLDDMGTAPHAQTQTDLVLLMIVAGAIAMIVFAGLLGLIIDVHAELQTQKRLRAATSRDGLTGLLNSQALRQQIEHADNRPKGAALERACLISIDLDRFCDINEEHGYATGDAILASLAHRLSHHCGENEHVYHLGSDQFVVLKRGYDDIADALSFVEDLSRRLARPVPVAGISCTINPSIGFACFPEDAQSMQDTRKCAELALLRVKTIVGRTLARFEPELDRQDRARRALGEDLRTALSQNEFFLVYQAQTALSTHATSGFEALLRWRHPVHGVIPPDEFIPLAEANGVICDVGMWVLGAACREAASWSDPFSIAVNVSPQQLRQEEFHREVAEVLAQTGLEPSRLELEITESSIIADADGVRAAMRRLQSIGVRIALDDFGTGYASMATLQAFPFNKLKLDRCFVSDVHLDVQKAAIVRATVLLGEAMGIPVLAEGVEVPQELAFLKQEGCMYAQGFLMGTPMPVAELRMLVRELPRMPLAV